MQYSGIDRGRIDKVTGDTALKYYMQSKEPLTVHQEDTTEQRTAQCFSSSAQVKNGESQAESPKLSGRPQSAVETVVTSPEESSEESPKERSSRSWDSSQSSDPRRAGFLAALAIFEGSCAKNSRKESSSKPQTVPKPQDPLMNTCEMNVESGALRLQPVSTPKAALDTQGEHNGEISLKSPSSLSEQSLKSRPSNGSEVQIVEFVNDLSSPSSGSDISNLGEYVPFNPRCLIPGGVFNLKPTQPSRIVTAETPSVNLEQIINAVKPVLGGGSNKETPYRVIQGTHTFFCATEEELVKATSLSQQEPLTVLGMDGFFYAVEPKSNA